MKGYEEYQTKTGGKEWDSLIVSQMEKILRLRIKEAETKLNKFYSKNIESLAEEIANQQDTFYIMIDEKYDAITKSLKQSTDNLISVSKKFNHKELE